MKNILLPFLALASLAAAQTTSSPVTVTVNVELPDGDHVRGTLAMSAPVPTTTSLSSTTLSASSSLRSSSYTVSNPITETKVYADGHVEYVHQFVSLASGFNYPHDAATILAVVIDAKGNVTHPVNNRVRVDTFGAYQVTLSCSYEVDSDTTISWKEFYAVNSLTDRLELKEIQTMVDQPPVVVPHLLTLQRN